MSRISKQLSALALAAVLTAGNVHARPSQDSFDDRDPGLARRIIRIVKHFVKVVLGDELTVPHP
jgi:hypothetical protein